MVNVDLWLSSLNLFHCREWDWFGDDYYVREEKCRPQQIAELMWRFHRATLEAEKKGEAPAHPRRRVKRSRVKPIRIVYDTFVFFSLCYPFVSRREFSFSFFSWNLFIISETMGHVPFWYEYENWWIIGGRGCWGGPPRMSFNRGKHSLSATVS